MRATVERALLLVRVPHVKLWREALLSQVGLLPELPRPLARDADYGLHEFLGLVDRGGPPVLAARTRAPR